MRRVTPFILSSLETCAPPLEGAYVCAPANAAVRASYAPPMGGVHVRAPWLGAPLCRGRPLAACTPSPCAPSAVRTPQGVRAPVRAPRGVRAPQDMRAPRSRPKRRACPPCAPMEAIRALPRARLLSISSSKLLFILPLGHLGLQLP
jgi:hypothetical protein